ncbi:MAG TPA: hypothetical protein PK113_00180 [Bacillota bacterium]|nr:hypothetical protein [Bacillota bacterium]
MAKKQAPENFDNFKTYEDKVKMSSDKELKLFEDFYQQIKRHAEGHRQTTLNNLHESQESLSELKQKAEALKDSVFFHDETVIVDRQAIISETEDKIHKDNRNILEYEFNQAGERIDSLDYLNKALIQTKFNFFEQFRNIYTNQILDYDYLYRFYQDKTTEFDNILNKYHHEILESFQELDNEITDMDARISLLIQQKNSKLNDIFTFYDGEMKNYIDNQLTFSLEEDLKSKNVKNLIKGKLEQLEVFRKHLLEQESKVKKILHQEYLEIYQKTLDRLLKRKGNLMFEDTLFFYHPDEKIREMKQEIVEAEEKDFVTLKRLVTRYNQAIKYPSERSKCEKRAKSMTKGFLKLKKQIYLEYQKDSRNLIFQIEKYYKLFLELLKIDPFLAQIISDNSTKIIKDEINFLSILQINKEHKINVNFDIKTLKLKQQINEIESKLSYNSERLMIRQDIDILNTLRDIQMFFVESQGNVSLIMDSLAKEKYLIERLEQATNYHMEYLVKESNLNRKFLSMITQILDAHTRDMESHNIRVVEATAKIKLALKEYDILALHFNTMYENEKRFLVLQANRVSEETSINNEFVLTTFENRMRFAGEQIMLANDEYKLRVESIMRAVDEERQYYIDIIEQKLKKYRDREKNISDEYQAKLYYDSYMITETEESSHKKSLEKEIAKNKKAHDSLINEIEMQISEDKTISDAKHRLRELDAHLEIALEDALTIRDDTISEMSELYEESKTRYETLKPYLENKVNILDPTFYQQLEKMKKRHQYKMRAAEIELEDATKDLLDNYLVVYFEEHPEIDKELYLSQIEQLEHEREELKAEYGQNIADNEANYHEKITSLERDTSIVYDNIENLKATVLNKSEKAILQKQAELDQLEKRYNLEYNKQTVSFQKEITDLTYEYNNALIQNQKYYQNLSSAFKKILDSYYPYLKVAQNNKIIKQVVRVNEKRMKAIKSKENKTLNKKARLANYLKD